MSYESKGCKMNKKPVEDKETEFKDPGSNLFKWFENFWYHYKQQTIIALIAILTVVISTTQLMTREKYDFYTLYAGPQVLAMQDIVYIQRGISEFAIDYNQDGEVKVALNNIVMLSPDELAAANENGAVFNGEFIQKTMTEYYQQIIAGDAVICFLSPYMYEIVHKEGGFMTLTEIFGSDIPDAAYDDCGIVLSKTDFGISHNGIDDLPDDTIMCVRRVTTLKKSQKFIKQHEAYIELFKAMIEYSKD